MYLASDSDDSGPWLYSMDVARRIAHRLTSGLDRYTSLASSADGRRLVVTLANPKRTPWRLRIGDSSAADAPAAQRISLTTSTGFSPRLGPDYLLYVSGTGTSESIWKFANGTGTELWSGQGARIFGGPAISVDGRNIAFSVRQRGQTLLYLMQADGTNALWPIRSTCRVLQHGRPTANQSPRPRQITASHASSASRSTVAPPLLLARSTRSIPLGRPTVASSSTRAQKAAPRIL